MYSRLCAKGLWACLLLLVGTALCADVLPAKPAGDPGADPANPYSVIVERDVFRLNPIPPPPEPEKPKVELPDVKITGIVNIGNHHNVLFLSQPKDKKTGPLYYSLVEGEKSFDGKLELVRIHPSQDGVDIINDGVAVTLTMDHDTLGAVAGAGAAEGPKDRRPGGDREGQMPGRMYHPPGMPGMPGVPGTPNFTMPMRARRNLPQ